MVMGTSWLAFTRSLLVFVTLISRPVVLGTSCSLSALACIYPRVCDSSLSSSAKSKSSSLCKRLNHCCFHHPVDYQQEDEWVQDTVLYYSCVDSEGYRQIRIVDNSVAGIPIETLDDIYNLLRNAVVSQDAQIHCFVHYVKRLLEGNKTDIQR